MGEHGDTINTKVNRTIYLLRNLSSEVSLFILRTVYFSLLEPHLTYAILTWGHSSVRHHIFAQQRKAIRVVAGLKYQDDCREAFINLGALTLPCIYIYECVKYVKKNEGNFAQNCQFHDHCTRRGKELRPQPLRLTRSQTGTNYFGIKFFNKLPTNVRESDEKSCLRKTKDLLVTKAFYTFEEFLNFNFV